MFLALKLGGENLKIARYGDDRDSDLEVQSQLQPHGEVLDVSTDLLLLLCEVELSHRLIDGQTEALAPLLPPQPPDGHHPLVLRHGEDPATGHPQAGHRVAVASQALQQGPRGNVPDLYVPAQDSVIAGLIVAYTALRCTALCCNMHCSVK